MERFNAELAEALPGLRIRPSLATGRRRQAKKILDGDKAAGGSTAISSTR